MPDRSVATESRLKELKKRLEADPRSRVFMDLAKAHQKAGEIEEAVRVCREGLERHPGYHSARVLLGKLLLESGDHAQALEELRRVVVQAPENLLAWRLLGSAQEGAGRSAEALETYGTLLALTPGDPEIEARIASLEPSAAAAGEGARLAGTGPDRPEPGPEEEAAVEPEVEAEPAASGADPGDGIETLDLRQEVEEEAVAEGPPPSGEPVAEAPEAWRSLPPEDAVAEPLPEARSAPPEPAVPESPDREREPLRSRGGDTPAGPGEGPAREAAETGPQAREIPRTVALDPSDLPFVEDAEDRPTEVLEVPELTEPPEPLRPAAVEPAPPVASLEPPAAPEPAAGPGSEPPPGTPGGPPEEGPGPGADEARTVMMSAPVFEETSPAGPGETPGSVPAPPEGAAGTPEGPGDGVHEDALPTPTLAELYLEQGMPGKAVEVYRKLLEGDPDNEEVRQKLTELETGPAPGEPAALAKIRALQGWLEKIKGKHDAQSGP